MAKNRRMAGLEMTADDHLARGSTPLREQTDNPGKKWHELMDDERLRNFIAEQFMVVMTQYRRALTGNPQEMQIFKVQLDGFLAPNLAYLKEIGRIPDELKDFDPATEFALPAARANGGETVTLGGKSTKSDLVEIMKMAVEIIRHPSDLSDANKLGCALSLEMLAKGIT